LKRPLGIDPAAKPVQPQECVLKQICCRFSISSDSKRRPEYQLLVPVIQLTQRLQFTSLQLNY
jgi:hypothetical protein